MFQSTLLKRTMSLVVLSLVASAILATIAFVVAGRLSTMSTEVDNATQIDLRYKEIFTNHPEYLESTDFRLFFFDSTYSNGHDYYLINSNNEIVNATSLEHRSIGPTTTALIFPSLNSYAYDDLNGLHSDRVVKLCFHLFFSGFPLPFDHVIFQTDRKRFLTVLNCPPLQV